MRWKWKAAYTIKLSFLNYGLPNNLNKSRDDQIKIRGIEDYTMPPPVRKFTLLEDDQASGSDDEFTEVEEVDEQMVPIWQNLRQNQINYWHY